MAVGKSGNVNVNLKSLFEQYNKYKSYTDTILKENEKLITSFSTYAKEIKSLANAYTRMGSAMGKFNDSIKDTKDLKTNLADLSETFDASSVVVLGHSVDTLNSLLAKTEEKVKSIGEEKDLATVVAERLYNIFSAENIVTQASQAFSSMIDEVKELDENLIELQKVVDLNGQSLDAFVKRAYEVGETVAKTGSDVISAATEFAKSGYNESEALSLGKIALLYQNIADEQISASKSAEFIIAQMKAFNITAEESLHIIDAVNEVSNNFAVSSADIANNLGKSSVVLANSGSTLEEAIGLITGGTEIMRNASKVSVGK